MNEYVLVCILVHYNVLSLCVYTEQTHESLCILYIHIPYTSTWFFQELCKIGQVVGGRGGLIGGLSREMPTLSLL